MLLTEHYQQNPNQQGASSVGDATAFPLPHHGVFHVLWYSAGVQPHGMLRSTSATTQTRALADLLQGSLMLRFNKRTVG